MRSRKTGTLLWSILVTGILIPFARSRAESPPPGVGVILPLSGDIAAWGNNVRRGIELAAEGEPQLKVFFEDEAFCNSSKALTAYQELTARHGINVTITGCLNGTKVVTPIATRTNRLILSGGLLSGEEAGTDAQHLLSLSGQIAAEGEEIAKQLVAAGHQRLAFVRYEDEFTSAVLRAVQRGLQKTGSKTEIIDLPVPSDEMNMGPLLIRAKQKGADALLAYVGEKQLLTLIKRRNDLGFHVPTYSGYVIESNAFTSDDRKLLEGITYAYPKLARASDPDRVVFEQAYRKRYGQQEQPSSNSYFVYDGVRVLKRAFDACGDSAACVRKYFVKNGPFHGASGDFSYTSDGFINRQFVVKTIKNGEFVERTEEPH